MRTHVGRVVDETGDWRPAIDGLRPVTAQLWQGLDEDDKRRFLADHARTWDIHRHRMPPVTAARLDELSDSGRLVRHAGTVVEATAVPGGVEATLTDGERVTVGAIVNCTGPVGALAKSPLLAEPRAHRPGPARPLRTRHRHLRRRPGARRTARDHAALRPRRPATRQPVGDHGDARDPRAGLRRGPLRRPRAPRRDAQSPRRHLRPDAHDQPQGGGGLQLRARAPAAAAGRRRGRVWRRPSRGIPASPRPMRRSRCSATSGVPPARGAAPCGLPTRPRRSATSTTGR